MNGRSARFAAEALVVVLLGLGLWWGSGGRWVHVETPSMGTAAPVGSLLWISPMRDDEVDVGDLVTFHPPDKPDGTIYTHRVLAVQDDGSLRTGGDLAGPDPWAVRPADVVGEVRATWPGAGWLVVMAPVLLPGLVLLVALVAVVPAGRRPAAALALGAVLATVLLVVYQPLVGAERLPAPPDAREVHFVGTGLLPVRIVAEGSDASVTVRPGEVGRLRLVALTDAPREEVAMRLHAAPPPWAGPLLVLACLLPGGVAAARSARARQRRVSTRPAPRRAGHRGGGFVVHAHR